MKLKDPIFVLLLWGICTLSSCEKEEILLIQPSIDLINIEGEGGYAEVTFHNGDWIIDRIENRSADNECINGNIYSADEKIIADNTKLQLSGLGKLVSGGEDHGFTITRAQSDVMTITILENWTGEDFSFAIVLQSGAEEKEILVNQKKLQGYTFSKIEYVLEADDGDSFYVEQNRRSYSYIEEVEQVIVMPYTGLSKQSWFTVNGTAGLYWQQQSSVSVPVPVDVDAESGEIKSYSDDEYLFSSEPVSTQSEYIKVYTQVDLPVGYPFVTVKVTHRLRQLTYYITLTNNRTGDSRVISGKWIEKAPTSKYEIIVEAY